jgi:hypothetical protein
MTSQIDLSKFVDKKVSVNFRQNKRNPHEGYIKFITHFGDTYAYEFREFYFTKHGELVKGEKRLGDIIQIEEID